MDEAIKLGLASGLEVVCEIEQGGGRYVYLHGPGGWFELIEAGEGLKGFFGMMKTACENWDGKELLRPLSLS